MKDHAEETAVTAQRRSVNGSGKKFRALQLRGAAMCAEDVHQPQHEFQSP